MTVETEATERAVVRIAALVQLVAAIEFMMVMPLGPELAVAINLPLEQIGVIGGAYTCAGAIAGLIGAFFLDRFDRRSVLCVLLLGVSAATAFAGLANSVTSLLIARLLAGTFGGPCAGVALAVIADVVPPERRGKAVGVVMGMYAVSAVVGVPIALRLALWAGWRTPFFVMTAAALLVSLLVMVQLPSMTAHKARAARSNALISLGGFGGSKALAMFGMCATMLSAFLVIPNLSTFVQFNAGFPRDGLELLYMTGGIASYFAMRSVGGLVDRFGAVAVSATGVVLFTGTMLAFALPLNVYTVTPVFVGFMLANTARMVPLNVLSSRVPAPQERAQFLSLQSAVNHFSSGVGAVLSTLLLSSSPEGKLLGVPQLVGLALLIGLPLPYLLRLVERRLVDGSSSAPPVAVAGSAGSKG